MSNRFRLFTAGVLLAALCLASVPVSVQAAPPAQAGSGFNCTYVVQRGDNLYRIGLRFGVSPYTLAAVNGIPNLNSIFVGMVLRVPCGNTPKPPPNNCGAYVVQRGDWLVTIAARFGVSWQSLAAANHLSNPNLIYPGMRLIIPCGGGTPARVIRLVQPFPNQAVCSPVTVSGSVSVSPFEATLAGRVFNSAGQLIGEGPIHVNAEMGKPGTFVGQIAFDKNRATGFGTVQLAELSAKDGSVVVSASAPVRFNCP
jgi:LysM repeat protein